MCGWFAVLVDSRGLVGNRLWPIYSKMNDPGRGDRLALVEQEPKTHPTANYAEFQGTFFVYGTLQLCTNRERTVLRMARDVDGITT